MAVWACRPVFNPKAIILGVVAIKLSVPTGVVTMTMITCLEEKVKS